MGRVAIARIADYQARLLDEVLDSSLALLGGLGRYVRPSDRVLIKPNFLMAKPVETAVTTHPAFIAAVARQVHGAGAREIRVGDSPGGIGKASAVARKIGLAEHLDGLPVTLVDFDRTVARQGSLTGHSFQIAREVLEADCVINLPKVKTHGQMLLTGAVKNAFGAIVGTDKKGWHLRAGVDYRTFARALLDISSITDARLHLVDGITAMDGNGPANGDPRQLGLILASSSALEVDRVLAEVVGFLPERVPVLRAAHLAGLEGTDLERIEVVGAALNQAICPDFQPPAELHAVYEPSFLPLFLSRRLRSAMMLRPCIDPDRCILCGECQAHCPAQAIDREEGGAAGEVGRMVIRYSRCIRCYCCQELCPVGAVSIVPGPGSRLLGYKGA